MFSKAERRREKWSLREREKQSLRERESSLSVYSGGSS